MTYVFHFFYPTATAYRQRPKFFRAEHSAMAEGKNCAYGPTLGLDLFTVVFTNLKLPNSETKIFKSIGNSWNHVLSSWLTRAWNSKKKFCQKSSLEALWKCHLQKIFIIFSRVRQIQDLGQSKYKLRLSSKRTHGISKILSNLGSCENLARLESKIRKCLFFDGSLL